MEDRRANRLLSLPLILLLLASSGCGDGWRFVEMKALSLAAADSVAVGQPLRVRIAFYTDRNEDFDRVRWNALDDSTLSLRVFQRVPPYPYAQKTPPASRVVGSVGLSEPPARAFRILCGDLVLRVQGGAEPSPGNRLTVELQTEGLAAAGVVLHLSRRTPDPSLILPATNAAGVTTILGACDDPGAEFWLETAEPGQYAVQALGRWPSDCDQSQRLVTRATPLVIPTSAHHGQLSGAAPSVDVRHDEVDP